MHSAPSALANNSSTQDLVAAFLKTVCGPSQALSIPFITQQNLKRIVSIFQHLGESLVSSHLIQEVPALKQDKINSYFFTQKLKRDPSELQIFQTSNSFIPLLTQSSNWVKAIVHHLIQHPSEQAKPIIQALVTNLTTCPPISNETRCQIVFLIARAYHSIGETVDTVNAFNKSQGILKTLLEGSFLSFPARIYKLWIKGCGVGFEIGARAQAQTELTTIKSHLIPKLGHARLDPINQVCPLRAQIGKLDAEHNPQEAIDTMKLLSKHERSNTFYRVCNNAFIHRS